MIYVIKHLYKKSLEYIKAKYPNILLCCLVCACAYLFYLYYSCNNDYKRCTKPSVLVFSNANSRETYFTMHKIKEAQDISQGERCKVGILDHSFGMANHPELYAGGKNFVEDSDDYLNKHEWHGYWMANTLREIAPKAKIYALNTHSFKSPESHAEAISKAVDWAIENNLCVLTYSHAAMKGKQREIFNAAIDKAHKAGIVTTFIHTGHPNNILPFGLWDKQDDGRSPDINILQNDYNVVPTKGWKEDKRLFLSISSTSPVVGGVVAMMKSVNPNLTPSDCKKIIRATSYPINYEGQKVPRVLDALAAVKYAKSISKL